LYVSYSTSLTTLARIQLKIADERGIKLLLASLSEEKDSNAPIDITFQCAICEILANCCERVKVRIMFRKTKGLVRVLKFLLIYQDFFDQYKKAVREADPYSYTSTHRRSASAPGTRPLTARSGATTPTRVPNTSRRGSSILRPDNLHNLNRKVGQKLIIIYNASRVLWKASKSSTLEFVFLTLRKKSRINSKNGGYSCVG
jgi:hypothetical protein